MNLSPEIKLIDWPKVFDLLSKRWDEYKDERAISHALRWLRYRNGLISGYDFLRSVPREALVDYVAHYTGCSPEIAQDCVPPEMTSSHFRNWLKTYDALANDKHLPWHLKQELFDEICFY